MKLVIITHVPHTPVQNQYFAYGPYVREMIIWAKYVDEFIIVAPVEHREITPIDSSYGNMGIDFRKIPIFNLTSFLEMVRTFLKIPFLIIQIFKAMYQADHIHLRCPGNVGLLGCLVQILFPSKPKTAKYAGNWDPQSKQPWSYCLQKWILSNTFLTKNMQVLVYGQWENQSKNIKSFFTASYNESEIEPLQLVEEEKTIRILFVGTLVAGKNPMYALLLVSEMVQKGIAVQLDLYGAGVLRKSLERYVHHHDLSEKVFFHGNQNSETIKKAYQKSHFLILPSQSEGWPKAVAEAMFWGCVPVATPVSCVPYMLDFGNRGVLLTMDCKKDAVTLAELFGDKQTYCKTRVLASSWSRMYTLDYFENEIEKIVGV